MTTILILILIAVVLFILEVILPGGILGTIGGLTFLGAVYLTWVEYGVVAAIITFVLGVVFTILMFILQVNILSKSRLGKHIILGTTTPGTSNLPTGDDSIIGRDGVTLSKMAPSGRVRIDGKSFEAISQSGLLEKGESIEVVQRDAFRLVVRKKGG